MLKSNLNIERDLRKQHKLCESQLDNAIILAPEGMGHDLHYPNLICTLNATHRGHGNFLIV
jgi:hypothetical protein